MTTYDSSISPQSTRLERLLMSFTYITHEGYFPAEKEEAQPIFTDTVAKSLPNVSYFFSTAYVRLSVYCNCLR